MMRTAVLLAIIALASAAAAGETSWSQTVAEWLDHYYLVVGRYTRTDFTSHQGKRVLAARFVANRCFGAQEGGALRKRVL